MNNLVNIANGQAVTTSRQVAEHFEKEHKNVLASIKEILAAEKSATSFFSETTYENRGKHYPEYLMNRDGFTLLAMGFTGSAAMHWKLKYIQAFNEMEKQLVLGIPQTYAAALRLAADQAEKLVLQAKQIELDRPKVIFADSVAASKTSILIGELAKILKQNGVDIGQNRLFEWMRNNGHLVRRQGTDYNMPTQRSMEMGLFTIKETSVSHSDGHVTVSKTPKVTGKGQQYFVNKFLADTEEKAI